MYAPLFTRLLLKIIGLKLFTKAGLVADAVLQSFVILLLCNPHYTLVACLFKTAIC